MKLPFLLLAVSSPMSWALRNETRGNLRRVLLDEEHVSVQELLLLQESTTNVHRVLTASHNHFMPLDCNTPSCQDGSSTWTAEGYDPAAGTVVIPCGKCVTFDYDDPSSSTNRLELPHGLDVQGLLRFTRAASNKKQLVIETPFLRVQGELIMRADGDVVTDDPNIKILLTGNIDTSFVPAGHNQYACSEHNMGTPDKCHVGSKPVVIAGGQVTLRGIPDTCKTWVQLEDVPQVNKLPNPDRFSKLPDLSDKPAVCQGTEPYMKESFTNKDNLYGWTGGTDGEFKVTNQDSFMVSGRQSSKKDGPAWEMIDDGVRDCLVAGQTYLFSAKVRLHKPGVEDGAPTTCAEKGSGCLRLRTVARSNSGDTSSSRKGGERPADDFTYGMWHKFYASFTFDPDELGSDLSSHMLQLDGPGIAVDIEMDDVTFGLPPPSTMPNPSNVCGGNLLMNGDGSASSIHPYPMEVFGNGRIVVETTESDGNFFRVDGRTSKADSIAQYLDAPGCIVPSALYKVSAEVRVQSLDPVQSIITFRAFHQNGDVSRFVVAECPASTQEAWVHCESTFSVQDRVEDMRFSFETLTGARRSLDVKNWRVELVEASTPAIVVQEDGIKDCWGEGAEILITSHTIDMESRQVRRLMAPPESYENGLVLLHLDSSIMPPVTVRDGDGFAVEVALLSRNIVFQGAADENDNLLGGHLIVLHTPNVPQLIEGVEFRNFGRQGELGRYPIHFHMCADVDGSIVSKNSIRESNQRCVVVHGSHNLTVIENVAFETKGHCYILEDGGEIDNKFIRNLGASTRAAKRIVRSGESDDSNPSTFWASNPANTWIENVAAGSESSGFWFELQREVKSPTSMMPLSAGMVPREMPLKLFRDNVMHSNFKHGLRTYPIGYAPPSQAVFHNTKSYKNGNAGIFFHLSQNLKVEGGILADNELQADIDRADNIVIAGTEIIGVSNRFRDILSTELETRGHTETVVGIQLHGFATDMANEGTKVSGVRFSGFSDTRAARTALIDIDDNKQNGYFDYWSTVEDVSIEGSVSPLEFDFSKAVANGFTGIFLTDKDSSMKPANSAATGTSSVVSSTDDFGTFLDMNKCDDVSDRGYYYCGSTCLRAVTFATSPAKTDFFVLRLWEKTNPSKSFDFEGRYFDEVDDDGKLDVLRNTWIRKHRYFITALPAGDYQATFVDSRTDEAVWPQFAEVTYEPASCSGALEVGDVNLQIPPPSKAECRQLVKNSQMEFSAIHWLHSGENGVEHLVGDGVDGSNAIADTSFTSAADYIGQFVDTRCLGYGEMYEVRAWVKLTTAGEPFQCSGDECPTVELRFRTPTDATGQTVSEMTRTVAASFVSPLTEDWNLVQGVFTIDSRIAVATNVALVVRRGLRNAKMHLDNVTMRLVTKNCEDLVFDGDFSTGTSVNWEVETDGKAVLQMTSVIGDPAIELVSRSSSSDKIIQNVQTGCIEEARRYVAVAKVKLIKSGSHFECTRTERTGDKACPRMRLKSFVDLGLDSQRASWHDGGYIADVDYGLTSDGWYTISGVFSGTIDDEFSEQSILSIEGAAKDVNLIVDDVSITPFQGDCTDLFVNGKIEGGETARFWRSAGKTDPSVLVVESQDSNKYLKVTGRENVSDGLAQFVDPVCMTNGSSWRLTAKMKLLQGSTGKGVACEPGETPMSVACPSVRVSGFRSGARTIDERIPMASPAAWNAALWNEYEVLFDAPQHLSDCDRVEIAIRWFNAEWDMVVDDLSLSPI